MPRALQNRCAKYVIKTFQKRKASLTGCSVTSGKPHFGPNLGLLGLNLGQRFFLEGSALLHVRHCPKLQYYAISRKTNESNLRKYEKLNFRHNFEPPNFFCEFYLY